MGLGDGNAGEGVPVRAVTRFAGDNYEIGN